MIKTRIYVLTVAAALMSGCVATQAQTAPEITVYTLRQCREMAVRYNAQIHISDNGVRAAAATRREAFSKYFPEVMGGASVFQANHDMIQYDVLDLFTLGIIKKGASAGIWAIQPVFMGGQIVNGNRLARVGEDVARIRREQAVDNVILQTDDLYWRLAAMQSTRLTVESAITMLDSLAVSVKAAVDAGMVVQNDLLKVNIKRNQYCNALVDLDNGLNLLRMLLAQDMGLGTTEQIEVDSRVPENVPAFPDSLYVDGSVGVEQTADHRLLVKNIEAKRLEKRMEVGRNLPSIAVEAGWFYHNVFEQGHNFGAVMATVTVPISGWWGGSNSIKRKNLELENARTELADLSQKLEIAAADKWDALTGAYRKMQISHQDIDQSRENLRITRAYYDAGMNTITDLLDAQTLYTESQSNYIAAYGAFKLAISQYLNATGRLE